MTVQDYLALAEPTLTVTLEDGFGYVDVTLGADAPYADDVVWMFGYQHGADEPVTINGDSVRIYDSGTYYFVVAAFYGDIFGDIYGQAVHEMYIEVSSFVFPPVDDDDEYVPVPVPQPEQDSGDDNTTTIVACAAAAVVAALIAAYLIIDRRQ